MATFELSGTSNGVIKYTDDNNKRLRIVISQIISYRRAGDGYISLDTAKGDLRLKLDGKPAVTTAIALLDSQF